MFGKPKRAKAVAKPRNAAEAAKVQRGLREKYPDMMNKTGPWSKTRKTTRTQQVSADLAAAGLTPEEIKRLGGG